MYHPFQPKVLSQASTLGTDFCSVQLEAERAPNLGDLVGSAEWPQDMLGAAGQLASEPGEAQASIYPTPFTFLIPDVKYIISGLINHSPCRAMWEGRGRGIHFLH